jgi:hypothetical protein
MEVNDILKILSLTQSEIDAISSPEESGIVYNSTTKKMNQYNGSDWEEVGSSQTPEALPVIVLKSDDNTNTFTRTSPLMLPWNLEKYKDSGFSHSNTTNNTRLIVDELGTYQFSGRIRIYNFLNQRAQPELKIFINGVQQDWNLDSGYIRNSGNASDFWTLEFTYEPQKLTANDYVELQLSHETSNTITFSSTFIGDESSFSAIKLQGTKGEKGDSGTGSNILIKKNGVTIGTVTDAIDIIGGVPVVDEGGNVTSIEVGNYAHATGITQMPSAQINEVSILSGSIDNYNISTYNVIFIDPGNSDRPFSGMEAPPAGVNRIVTIINSGTNAKIKFENNNSSSVAANRILLADNNNFDLPRGGSVQFIYKHSSSRWITYTYY